MKFLKSSILLSLCLLSLLSSAASATDSSDFSKSESIYVNLSNSGEPSGIFVVNSFDSFGASVFSDFGDYQTVTNLSDDRPISFSDSYTLIDASDNTFYYQGDLLPSTPLPWLISIRYRLDGSDIDPTELPGQSGSLDSFISVSPNSNCSFPFSYSHTMMITVSLDNRLCSNISATNATIASAGSSTQLSFTLLPNSDALFSFSADIQNFELEPISFACVRSELPFDLSSLNISPLIDDLASLEDAISLIDDGISDIHGNTYTLYDASNSIADGADELSNAISNLAVGADELSAGTASLVSALKDLSDNGSALSDASSLMLDAIFSLVNTSLANELSSLGFDSAPLLDINNYAPTLSLLASADSPAASQLTALKEQLDAIVSFCTAIRSYTAGVSELYFASSSIRDGASSLSGGLRSLSSAGIPLFSATRDVSTGMFALYGGIDALRQASSQLSTSTSGMSANISGNIDSLFSELSGSDTPPISFLSPHNSNTVLVQFILKTEGIFIPVPPPIPEPAPQSLNFWQKLLSLFGI